MEAAGEIPGAFIIVRVPWAFSHLANGVVMHPKYQIPKYLRVIFFVFRLVL